MFLVLGLMPKSMFFSLYDLGFQFHQLSYPFSARPVAISTDQAGRMELFGRIVHSEESGVPRQKTFVCVKPKVVHNQRSAPWDVFNSVSIFFSFCFFS